MGDQGPRRRPNPNTHENGRNKAKKEADDSSHRARLIALISIHFGAVVAALCDAGVAAASKGGTHVTRPDRKTGHT